ncbi:MAG: hypothetical protein JNJ50_00325 [Acidobacteria bacterium]|nr:hypothetical protein [Acidobacteriota bacterium]
MNAVTKGVVMLLFSCLAMAPDRENFVPLTGAKGGVDSVSQRLPMSASFCDVVKNPGKYDKKDITIDAIEVVNVVPVLDGGEPFLYDPGCDSRDSTNRLLIDIYNSEINRASDAFKEREKIILKATEKKDQQAVRLKVKLTGRFFAPRPEGGYGHLGWARTKIIVAKIERIEESPKETPWPLEYKP